MVTKQQMDSSPLRVSFGEWLAHALGELDSVASSRKFIVPLFILLLGYLGYGSMHGISIYDEGLICYGAERVLRGGVPYRDFWTAYGPGQFYLLAGVFKIFGVSLLIARVYTFTVEWLVSLLAYAIGRKLSSPLGGLASCISVAVWLNFDRTVLYPPVPAALFVLAGFLALAHSRRNTKFILLAGLFAGCATLIRQDMGTYALVVQSAMIAARRVFGSSSREERLSSCLVRALKQCLPYWVSTSAVVLPACFALSRAVPRPLLYEAFVDFPLRIYPQFRSVPFALSTFSAPSADFGHMDAQSLLHLLAKFYAVSIDVLVYSLPLLIPFLVTVFIIRNWPKRNAPGDKYWLAAGLTGFQYLLCFSLRVRPDAPHMIVAMVISLILFPWLLQALRISGMAPRVSRFVTLFLLLSVAILTFAGTETKLVACWLYGNGVELQPLGLARATGITIPAGSSDGMVDAVRYIQQRVPENQFIYVGTARHDRIFFNNAMFYFLSARDSATRYSELHPGVATTARVQSEIIEDLQRHAVTYVVLQGGIAADGGEPNRSSESSGVVVLDDFIHTRYEQVATFGNYMILRRSGASSTS
jgi:hypothetical protein